MVSLGWQPLSLAFLHQVFLPLDQIPSSGFVLLVNGVAICWPGDQPHPLTVRAVDQDRLLIDQALRVLPNLPPGFPHRI